MKQVLALLLSALLALSLAACGSGNNGTSDPAGNNGNLAEDGDVQGEETQEIQATPLQYGESIDNEHFTMSFDSLELLSEYSYETSEYSSTSLYVEEGYKILLVKGHIENKSTAAISGSAFNFSALVNDSFEADNNDVRLNFIRDNYFEIDPYTDLDYVLYVNIPEKLADMFETVTFTIAFNSDLSSPSTVYGSDGTKTIEADTWYTLTGGLTSGGAAGGEAGGSTGTEAQSIAIGDTITTSDCEFTLTNVELTYEVLPPNTSSVYSSYAAESGKVFVHVAADVKNTMQRDMRIDELFTVSALYDGKYPYEGFTVVNNGDNSFDWVSSYVAATPLETCKAHGIIECPAEVDTSGKSVVVTIELGGSAYSYTLR